MKLDARSNLGSNGAKFDLWSRIWGKSRIIDEKERKRRDESPKKTPNFMYLEICRLLFFFNECSLESSRL